MSSRSCFVSSGSDEENTSFYVREMAKPVLLRAKHEQEPRIFLKSGFTSRSEITDGKFSLVA